jgi:hypothetical protein
MKSESSKKVLFKEDKQLNQSRSQANTTTFINKDNQSTEGGSSFQHTNTINKGAHDFGSAVKAIPNANERAPYPNTTRLLDTAENK